MLGYMFCICFVYPFYMLSLCQGYPNDKVAIPTETKKQLTFKNTEKMSKTSKNILGDQRGKIGKVVGKVVDGVQMYSAYTDAVANPKTEKQIAHRARFAGAIALGKAMKGAVKLGLRDMASKKRLNSPFNIFVNINMSKVSYDKTTGTVSVDYEHVIIADGDVPAVTFQGATFTEPLSVTVNYTGNNDTPGARDDDSVYVIVYSPVLGRSIMGIGTRVAGSLMVAVPSEWSGESVQVWGFVRSSVEDVTVVEAYGVTLKPGKCSRSSYIGNGVVAEG